MVALSAKDGRCESMWGEACSWRHIAPDRRGRSSAEAIPSRKPPRGNGRGHPMRSRSLVLRQVAGREGRRCYQRAGVLCDQRLGGLPSAPSLSLSLWLWLWLWLALAVSTAPHLIWWMVDGGWWMVDDPKRRDGRLPLAVPVGCLARSMRRSTRRICPGMIEGWQKRAHLPSWSDAR